MRVVKRYKKGELTQKQAIIMLMNGYELTEEEAVTFLEDEIDDNK